MNSFQDLILELNSFFLLYKKVPENCIMLYDNLSGIKLKLINILSTYIYSIPDEKPLIPKIKEFESILEKYLKNIECRIDEFKRFKPHPKNIYDYQ
jgi:inorganic pyrophosphatase